MMALALNPTATATMSSAEISALTGKTKGNVHQDIKTQILIGLYDLKDDCDFNHIKIQCVTVVLDNRGYWSEVLLDHYHTDILISGYEVKYRAAIVKRWHELEAAQNQFSIPTTLSGALLLAGKLAAENEEIIAQREVDRPKVEFAEIVTEDSNTRCVRVTGKVVKAFANFNAKPL